MEKSEFLEAGQVVNTHGVRGEVKIVPWADDAQFLAKFKTLYIDGRGRKVLSARIHKGCLIALLEGTEDVNAAMALKNKTVSIRRADAKLPKGRFFIADIIGARAVTEDGTSLGTLEDVLELPSGNVYVVKGEREILIPAVPEFVLDTDVDGGVITVRLIEGM